MSELSSSYGRGPAYRYIRKTDRLPSTQEVPDDGSAVAKVKLFNPTGLGTWFLAGYDEETGRAFGVAEIQERELGYIDLQELVAYRGQLGLPIERDLHWTPCPLSDLL